MAMLEDRTFNRNDVLPSYIVNRLQDHVSNLSTNFRVRAQNATTLQVPAAAGAGAAGIGIQGKWRWIEATYTKSMPGGAAGTYSVFAVAKADSVSNTPQPNTDNTDYSFQLAITTGANPTIVAGTLDVFRLVALVEWDGSKITAVVPQVANSDNTIPLNPTADTAAQTPLRVHGPVGGGIGADLAQFKDQPGGTVLAAIGATGQLRVPSLLMGGDVALSRSVAGHLGLGAGNVLDLSTSGGTDATSGSAAGDKIVLGAGIGLGVQTNRLVAYVPAGQALAIRTTTGAGQKSSGVDAITLAASGAITAVSATLSGALAVSGNLGFYGVTPVARPAARTMTNWTIGANAKRAIDRNFWGTQDLFDFVMTMAYDHQQTGMFA